MARRARKSGLPPSRMSVPRPAMLVAMVTAPTWPAWEMCIRDSAGEAEGRYYSREQLERYRTEVAPYLIFPNCGDVGGWTPANSYMKGKLDIDGLIAEMNGQ